MVRSYTQFRDGKRVKVSKYKRKSRSKKQVGLHRSGRFIVVPVRDSYGRFGHRIRYVRKRV